MLKFSEYFNSFRGNTWREEIDVRDFIQNNYTPYEGDSSFLESVSKKTDRLWKKLTEMFKEETKRGVYDVETKTPQTIETYAPGYITKKDEVIVGLQTDVPLKRGIFPKGGWRMVEKALESYGYKLDPLTKEIYTKYRKTHNDGVFSAYTSEMLACRKSGIITGLPDAYSRGRIIGDYRRIALYGVNNLIEERKQALEQLDVAEMTESDIRYREEISEQIKVLESFARMCASYGFDVSRPAQSAKEAIQWLYFGFLGSAKDQDGAAMSLGRTSTFLDIFIEKDLTEVRITEKEAQ